MKQQPQSEVGFQPSHVKKVGLAGNVEEADALLVYLSFLYSLCGVRDFSNCLFALSVVP